jgi:hypothetical protein
MNPSTVIRTGLLAILLCAASVSAVSAQPLEGTTGDAAGDLWQSSWLNLKPPMTFKKGERLLIRVEGNAENVPVRLLPDASHPSSSDGIEGNIRKVPVGRVLDVRLERDHPGVKQISVHAGKEAWGRPLGGNNGTVRIVGIERRPQ